MAKLDAAAEQEKFERYLADMPFVVEPFVEQASAEGYVLDGTMESLDILEEYLFNTRRKTEDERETLINRAARYYGEVVTDTYGGIWKLAIEDPNDIYYGLPIIVGHTSYNVELCPIQTIRRLLRRKIKGLLRQVVQNERQPTRLDLTPE